MTRSKLLRPLLLGAFAAAPASIAAMGCASEATPPAQVIASPGQLMLAVNTDMMPGKDFDEIRIVVTQDRVTNDSTSFTWTVTEGQVRGSVKLPTTVAVVRGENTSGLTHIRALAYRDGEARVVRDIDVSIPTEGQLLLPIRIEALCVDALRHGKTGTVRSTCDEGSTCIAGGCASTYVDARALATYTPQAVFGGAAAPGASGSKCFDVLAAFSGGFDATPHLEDDACVLTARDLVKPALAGDAGVDGDAGAGDAGAVEGDAGPDQAVHFAGNLAWRQGPGVFGFCTDDLCLVPIPKGSTSGWSVRGTRITVPRAVCDSPEPRIAVSLKGPSVDALVPACGEWSSAGDQTRATAFAEPFVANGSTCGTLASLCAAQHTTCGTIWAKDSHCGLVRLASCGSCDGDTRGMVLIPGGNFLLGSAASDPVASTDEMPQTLELVSPFWMDRTDVTAAAYSACVQAGRCTRANSGGQCNMQSTGLPVPGKENHPVNSVDWFQASAYCSWMGLRLPTEVEWEYEAKGGAQGVRTYPWGEALPTPAIVCMSDKEDSDLESTCEVGSHSLGDSVHGLHDMVGNVWQWTSSVYSAEGHGTLGNTDERTEKGACWTTFWTEENKGQLPQLRGAFRSLDARGYRSRTVGFRCARDL